jgi:hypothetical protein
MMRCWLLLVLASFVASPPVFAQESSSDWTFNASVGWAWRDIDGTLFGIKPPLTGFATADSLGLGSSSEAQATFGVRWKRLGVRLVYMPSEFTGDGTLLQVLDFGDGPVFGNATPISSKIKVEMTLANLEYDLLERTDMDWGVGAGLGKIDLDIAMLPAVGPETVINGDVPFGYLTTTFTKRWQKFSLAVGLQGLSVSVDNYAITYRSLSLAAAYTFHSRDDIQLDVFAGYRRVDFEYDFDDKETGARTNTDFSMVGPNIGVRIIW